MSAPDQDFHKRMQRIEGLLHEAEQFADPHAQAVTRELVQSLMDLHGAGIGRMMELTAENAAPKLMHAFAGDELVASLLLLYGLHPHDIESRVRQALDTVQPQLRSYKAEIELLAFEEGVVRLKLSGCDNHETAQMLVRAVEEALLAVAPDLGGVRVEGVPEPRPDGLGRLSLPLVAAQQGARP